MANTSPTIVEQYIAYWKEHISTLEEDGRRTYFTDVLVDVALRLYGASVALELSVLVLKGVSPEMGAERVYD